VDFDGKHFTLVGKADWNFKLGERESEMYMRRPPPTLSLSLLIIVKLLMLMLRKEEGDSFVSTIPSSAMDEFELRKELTSSNAWVSPLMLQEANTVHFFRLERVSCGFNGAGQVDTLFEGTGELIIEFSEKDWWMTSV
jgi:hypothetical protein